jgi:hypothetical protein
VAPASPETLRVAFEYRGDVTLTLDDGATVEGYVANVGPDALRLWTKGSTSLRDVPTARVKEIALTGRDTAAGQSFATWKASREQASAAAPAAG